MRGAILHAPGDVRYEERPDPVIAEAASWALKQLGYSSDAMQAA